MKMFKLSVFDVSFSTLQKHQRPPYGEFIIFSSEHAKREALLISEDTGLCVKVKNIQSGVIGIMYV